MANETSYEVGQKVRVKATNFRGVVKKLEGEVVRLDVFRDRHAVVADHVDVPYTLDEVEPLRESTPEEARELEEHVEAQVARMTPEQLDAAGIVDDPLVHILDSLQSATAPADVMLCQRSCAKAPAATPFGFVLDDDEGRSIATCPVCKGAYDRMMTPERREEVQKVRFRERMRVRSQMPHLDNVFTPEIDFPGVVVKPGAYAERSFALGRECRLVGISKPKGLTLVRLVLKVDADFRAKRKANTPEDPPYTEYEGKHCLVYEGEAIKRREWSEVRLVPALSAGIYLLVRNDTADDLRFEGTLKLAEDRVPEPDHDEV